MASTTERRRRRSSYEAVPRWVTPWRIIAAVLAVVVTVVGVYAVRTVLALSNAFKTNPVTAIGDLLHHGNSAVATKFAHGQRITLALYGYGGDGHDGAFLTDSVMVVSIQSRGDNQKPRISEISIPRDWWVPIDLGNGRTAFGRINEAYESGQTGYPHASTVYTGDHGGGEMADATLERMLGVHIDYFVGMDFTAFKDAVDAVGGIDINVEHTFTDYKYPRGECAGPHPDCSYETIHFDAGPQHMDGATALIFARSRESSDPQEGTNFARNKRQQLVLTAVKQKALSVGGVSKLPDLLNALGDHVIMNLNLDDALSLYDLVKDVDTSTIEHVSIDDTNFIYECGYPTSCDAAIEYPHDRTFASLQHFVQNMFVDPAVIAEKQPVTVMDGSGGGAGASARWAQLLGDLGLKATDGGQARTATTTRVIDTSAGRGTRTAQWLAQYFGVQVETPTPAEAQAQGLTPGVTLVLGRDEERAFNNTTPGLYAGYFGGGSTAGSFSSGSSSSARSRRATPARPTACPTSGCQ